MIPGHGMSSLLLNLIKGQLNKSSILSRQSYSALSSTRSATGVSNQERLLNHVPSVTVSQCRGVSYTHYAKIRRPIQGWPRPLKWSKTRPENFKYNWIPILPLDGRYTTKPLRIRKLAGRDPVTGRVVVRTIGGGNKKAYRWVDYDRAAPEGQTIEEKVYLIRYDPLHTFLIALVARGGFRRWIMASEHMKPGDIIRTSNIIPKNPIRVTEGDAWPVGAMPVGTLIHNINDQVNFEGKRWCINAGTHAEIGRRMGKHIVVKLPHKAEIAIDERCMATVGKCSNTDHHMVNKLCAQRRRWKGKRPKSGLWHRKDGYCGRRNHPPKPLLVVYSDQRMAPAPLTMPIHILAE